MTTKYEDYFHIQKTIHSYYKYRILIKRWVNGKMKKTLFLVI